MEQAADHVAHEQQRDQHRDQRHRQRDDGEADLLRALERRLVRAVAALEIAGDVLDHDDRVVDDEAGGDGQRHQRQIVEAEAEQVHDRRACRPATAAPTRLGMIVAGTLRRKRKITSTTRPTDSVSSNSTSLTEARMVTVRSVSGVIVDRLRQRRGQRRQQRLDAVDDLDDVRAGLALDVDEQRRRPVHPRRQPRVFGGDLDRGDVGEQHRRAVAVGDDRFEIVAGIADLVVGVDGERLRRAVEIALRRIDVEVGDGRAQVVEVEAVGGERERIGVDAHRRALAAGDRHQADAGKLRRAWARAGSRRCPRRR